jgi:hypothetical protein
MLMRGPTSGQPPTVSGPDAFGGFPHDYSIKGACFSCFRFPNLKSRSLVLSALCALVTLAAMVRSEECEKTCVGCETLRPAGYSGWRGPNGDYCSRDKCRKKVEELNGGSAKDKRIAQLEACVKQQSEQISAQKELIDLLKLQLRQASGQTAGSGGGHLIAQAGGGASEVREVAVGEKRPAPEAAPAARPAACDTLRHGAVDRAPLQRLDRVNLPVQQPRPAKRPNTAASGRPQAAQLPRGWSTRVATSTGRSVWEQAFHRVRLEHEPDASRVCATILKQLLHLREPNPGETVSQKEQQLQIMYEHCMGWEIRTCRDPNGEKHASWRRAWSVVQPVPVLLSS